MRLRLIVLLICVPVLSNCATSGRTAPPATQGKTAQQATSGRTAPPATPGKTAPPATSATRTETPTVQGWEGFFNPDTLNDTWLKARGIPLNNAPIDQVRSRVVKLILAGGTTTQPAEAIDTRYQRYCTEPSTRAWNEDACKAMEARTCAENQCEYEYFGNCSGFLIGGNTLLTAAHCVEDLIDDEARRARSAVLLPGPNGRPSARVALGEIKAGKRDFQHYWVALEDEDPIDAASVGLDIAPLEPWPTAELPALGAPLFMVGYPRSEHRPAEAQEKAGYQLVPGTLAVSFGRLADPNEADHPFCSVDGYQEHWALAAPCPSGEVMIEGDPISIGPILNSPFLGSQDATNGFSGAPVFDAAGRLIGVNATVLGDVNPQEEYSPATRAVGTPIGRVLSRLGLGGPGL